MDMTCLEISYFSREECLQFIACHTNHGSRSGLDILHSACILKFYLFQNHPVWRALSSYWSLIVYNRCTWYIFFKFSYNFLSKGRLKKILIDNHYCSSYMVRTWCSCVEAIFKASILYISCLIVWKCFTIQTLKKVGLSFIRFHVDDPFFGTLFYCSFSWECTHP